MSSPEKKMIQCLDCLGIGLVKMNPIRCDCLTTFCMKCENNEGFKVKPYETCQACDGSGEIINKNILNNNK